MNTTPELIDAIEDVWSRHYPETEFRPWFHGWHARTHHDAAIREIMAGTGADRAVAQEMLWTVASWHHARHATADMSAREQVHAIDGLSSDLRQTAHEACAYPKSRAGWSHVQDAREHLGACLIELAFALYDWADERNRLASWFASGTGRLLARLGMRLESDPLSRTFPA